MNNMNHSIHEFAVQLIQNCPVCQKVKPIGIVEVIDEKPMNYLLRASCKFCNSGMMLKVQVMPNGLFGSVLVTDLAANEIERFRKEKAVSVDHVINAHSLSDKAWKEFINS